LYFEVSYLIKEVEGLLQEEGFTMLRPSGYQVTTRNSTGLEPLYVEMWLPKSMNVAFSHSQGTSMRSGQSVTPFADDLKILLLRVELQGKGLKEPTVRFACLDRTRKKKEQKKFEQLMAEFAYYGAKMFSEDGQLSYENAYCSLSGRYKSVPLFSIQDSAAVAERIVKPMLKLYGE
jgi:hypothetical protein